MPTYLMALGCVIGLAVGQLLFKASANAFNAAGHLAPRALGLLAAAVFLYGVITLAWVWLLRTAELGRIYPIMALAFAVVPLGSHYFFGESFAPRYFIGVALIMGGVALTYAQG